MKSRCNFRLTSFAKTLITSFWRKTKKITYAMSSSSAWANIAQGNYLCNIYPWLTDDFYEENNLYNVVLIMLRQHCFGSFLQNITSLHVMTKPFSMSISACSVMSFFLFTVFLWLIFYWHPVVGNAAPRLLNPGQDCVRKL